MLVDGRRRRWDFERRNFEGFAWWICAYLICAQVALSQLCELCIDITYIRPTILVQCSSNGWGSRKGRERRVIGI